MGLIVSVVRRPTGSQQARTANTRRSQFLRVTQSGILPCRHQATFHKALRVEITMALPRPKMRIRALEHVGRNLRPREDKGLKGHHLVLYKRQHAPAPAPRQEVQRSRTAPPAQDHRARHFQPSRQAGRPTRRSRKLPAVDFNRGSVSECWGGFSEA